MAKKNKEKKEKKRSEAGSAESNGSAATAKAPKFKHVRKKKLSTGKGASAAEIGRSLVELFNAGKPEEVERLWHHKKIESIEGDGTIFDGRKGIAEKNEWWHSAYDVHSARAEGPFVGATGFTVHFLMDITPKAGGQRVSSREVGVYCVEKGKIVREEFMHLA